jgi:glycolate oxidase FAD binding subunit
MARIEARSESEVIDAVAAARAHGSTLEIVGHGTKRALGRPVETVDVLDVAALSGIVSYEPDELVVTVKAGTTIVEIEEALAHRAQRLGFDPADWGPMLGEPAHAATIGGVLSADACGPARVRFGAARDHLLGYRAINGWAESYKAGGHVVKNVTGFDLPKLMCGAMGTLGVLTEVTLRLVPRAALNITLVARDMPPDDGLALLRRAWTSAFGPTGLAYLPGATTAAFPELGAFGQGAALIRVEGSRVPLDEKMEGIRALAPRVLLQEIDGEEIFRAIGNGRAYDENDTDVWRVFLPPQAASRYAHDVGSRAWIADWAGGVIWASTPPDDDTAAQRMCATASAYGGQAMLLRVSPSTGRHGPLFQAEPPTLAALNRSVKAAFDPLGIFNPRRLYEDF